MFKCHLQKYFSKMGIKLIKDFRKGAKMVQPPGYQQLQVEVVGSVDHLFRPNHLSRAFFVFSSLYDILRSSEQLLHVCGYM